MSKAGPKTNSRPIVKTVKSGRNVITGRLKNEGAFNEVSGIPDGDSGKASVIQAQRQLKALQEENDSLKTELEYIKTLYDQLVSEGSTEQYGERRVNLLKSQVIQLERQVLLQTEALSSRSGVLFEVENNLQSISDDLRELLSHESKGPSVPVQRSCLTTMIETAQSARLRLYKNLESNNRERLERPMVMMGHFAKRKPHPYDSKPLTVLDVCSGRLDHLSLKHVAKLESKLFSLNQQLHTLHQSLNTAWSHENVDQEQPANQHLPSAVQERLSGLLSRADRQLVECCQDLLALSLLVPSAPWPLLSKSVVPEINIDSVMAALPSLPKNKQPQIKSVIEAVIKASNYSRRVSKMEAKACVEELRFHQALYHVQLQYMESLYAAVREAYTMFEKSIQATICVPVKDVLGRFEKLKETASEDALREFLTTFKSHREQIESTINGLTRAEGDGAEAISDHGQQFLEAVKAVARRTAAERDRLVGDLEEVKKMRDEHLIEGLDVLRVREGGVEEGGDNKASDIDNKNRGEL